MVGLECKLMACKSFWTNLISDSREFMTEDASGSFLFETEDENCCSSEQIGDDEEERSE